MESIAALGLACNVFQVISFGQETMNLVRDVYGKGSIEVPLAEYAVTLRDAAAHIKAFELPEKPRKHEVQLADNAAKCHLVARDLGEEINFLLAEKAKGDLLKTLKTVTKMAWRKRRLDRLEKQLRDLEKQMQSGLLARLCDKTDMMQTAQETLSQDVRHLLQQFRFGKTQASDLILRDGLETRQHISLESSKLRREIVEYAERSHEILFSRVDRVGQASATQVTSHLNTHRSDREISERRDRFIDSLSYYGMNERRNHASDSHSGTFEWIFSEIESEQEQHQWGNFADWLRSNESAIFSKSGDRMRFSCLTSSGVRGLQCSKI
ncbi:hypothetical protein CKAH01_17224 [Colletotrichum kahawae]|uniref:Uncharacterized protein n=1 Tax=Colletotrichum kahawae TaxID=34407 RepID=A0AAE0D5D2_COLKA|nr:hypothetical protein CKAH01_17224 [Colletotrichum kahawae]